MRIEFIGKKAELTSLKHFGNKLSVEQMKKLVEVVITSAEYVGVSDRSNGKFPPAKIIWSTIGGIMLAVVIDSNDVSKNKATVISVYDVKNASYKAKRFNMKKVIK